MLLFFYHGEEVTEERRINVYFFLLKVIFIVNTISVADIC